MPVMRNPRSHFAPLAIGAPEPLREIPVSPMRMIHFFDPSSEKMLGRLPEMAASADILLEPNGRPQLPQRLTEQALGTGGIGCHRGLLQEVWFRTR